MINELETVELIRDIPKYGLKKGDLGEILNSNEDKDTFEIGFINVEGMTVTLITLNRADVRKTRRKKSPDSYV